MIDKDQQNYIYGIRQYKTKKKVKKEDRINTIIICSILFIVSILILNNIY